jgi:bacteriocin biosynthesis cyclodehydratase domain-containing protein
MEALHLLTGAAPPASEGHAIMIDLRTLESRREPVERDPGCPECSRPATPSFAAAARATPRCRR